MMIIALARTAASGGDGDIQAAMETLMQLPKLR